MKELLGLRLDSVPLFRGIAPDDLARLVRGAVIRDVPPDATLIAEGDTVEAVLVIISGAVRVLVGDRVVNDLGPGACLGEMSLVTREVASATVMALGMCRVLRIERAVFERALSELPSLSQNLGGILARRLRETSRRSVDPTGTFVPFFATPPTLELARAAANHLAARVAYYVGKPVLVVDCTRDEETELPGLETLVREPSRIEEHERVAAGQKATWVRVTGTMTPRVVPALAALFDDLCSAYTVVIALLPGESPSLAALAPRVRCTLVVLDETDPVRYIATRASAEVCAGDRALRFVSLESRLRSRLTLYRDAKAHEREHGRPVRVVRVPDGQPRTSAPTSDLASLDRLAREVLGMLVGVALGAGGTRGFAHVGVLETLAGQGVPIDCIAGTSIGSVVGSLWAFGHSGDEIMGMLAETRKHLVRWTVPFRSLLSSRGIRAHIERSAAGRTFADSPIPLAVVAADIHDGTRVVLRDGDVALAILASSSIPGVFPAVQLDGRHLVDGGVCEPVPTATVSELGAQVLVGVTLGARRDVGERKPFGVLGSLLRTNEIMQGLVNDHSTVAAHVVISPELRATSLSLKEFELAGEFREAGRKAALAALPRLRALLPFVGGWS